MAVVAAVATASVTAIVFKICRPSQPSRSRHAVIVTDVFARKGLRRENVGIDEYLFRLSSHCGRPDGLAVAFECYYEQVLVHDFESRRGGILKLFDKNKNRTNSC